MTLIDFLLARIAEDEETNDGMVRSEVASCRADGMPNLTEEEIREFWGEQVWWRRRLAECEAKRRIVERLQTATVGASAYGYEEGYRDGEGEAAVDTLRLLALPYADHPDYDRAWRP